MNKVFCGKQTNKPEKQDASTSGPPPFILRLDLLKIQCESELKIPHLVMRVKYLGED